MWIRFLTAANEFVIAYRRRVGNTVIYQYTARTNLTLLIMRTCVLLASVLSFTRKKQYCSCEEIDYLHTVSFFEPTIDINAWRSTRNTFSVQIPHIFMSCWVKAATMHFQICIYVQVRSNPNCHSRRRVDTRQNSPFVNLQCWSTEMYSVGCEFIQCLSRRA